MVGINVRVRGVDGEGGGVVVANERTSNLDGKVCLQASEFE